MDYAIVYEECSQPLMLNNPMTSRHALNSDTQETERRHCSHNE